MLRWRVNELEQIRVVLVGSTKLTGLDFVSERFYVNSAIVRSGGAMQNANL